MKINLKEFEKILNKASVGNCFDFVQLLVSDKKIKSSLSMSTRALTTILTLDNTFLEGLNSTEILEMNFNTPNIEIIPHLKLFSSEVLECSLIKGPKGEISTIKVSEKETKMAANWNLAIATSTKIFNNPSFVKELKFFTEIDINEDFAKIMQSLKKIAYSTNKIYFTTDKEKKLSVETGDRKQKHVNTFKIELQDIDDSLPTHFDNIAICLDARILISVMDQINTDENFKIKIAYKPEKKIGMVCITNDDTETYIIPQLIEIDNNNNK